MQFSNLRVSIGQLDADVEMRLHSEHQKHTHKSDPVINELYANSNLERRRRKGVCVLHCVLCPAEAKSNRVKLSVGVFAFASVRLIQLHTMWMTEATMPNAQCERNHSSIDFSTIYLSVYAMNMYINCPRLSIECRTLIPNRTRCAIVIA